MTSRDGGRGPERSPAAGRPADPGEVEILPDGSVSIPVLEEQLVCEKRLVVRERIVVRKETVTEDRMVEADLRREHVAVEPDPEIAGRVSERRTG
jgi:uncharacterized protein (TIGR02271 family)